jgi:hypothetical protein
VALGNTDLVNVMTVFKNDNAGGLRGGRVAVLRSENRGSSWTGPITVDRLGTVEVKDPETGDPVRTGDIIPEIASDERAGNNDVYVVWQDARFNGFERDQVAFSRSTDGGLTWSTPVRISQDNETQAFTPAIRVDGDGNIGVTYYDFRNNDPATPGARDRHVVHALDRRRAELERGAGHPDVVRHAHGAGGARVLHGRLRRPDRPRRRLLVAGLGVARVDGRVVGAPDLAVRGAELHAVGRREQLAAREGVPGRQGPAGPGLSRRRHERGAGSPAPRSNLPGRWMVIVS